MAVFDENTILDLFECSLKAAAARLASLKVCCSEKPSFQGLNGWVFEQTIQYCLRKELRAQRIRAQIREQVSLGGRARADLAVGGAVAVEIKKGGLFDSKAASRYGRYRSAAERKGYSYLFLTLRETYTPYRHALVKRLGRGNAFFLDRRGEWHRLIRRIFEQLKKSGEAG